MHFQNTHLAAQSLSRVAALLSEAPAERFREHIYLYDGCLGRADALGLSSTPVPAPVQIAPWRRQAVRRHLSVPPHDARPLRENAFKIELARRTITAVLGHLAGVDA
jgi:hypothetical protein